MAYRPWLVDSPFRVPNWRWENALTIVARHGHLSPRRHDPATIAAVEYLRALRQCSSDRCWQRFEDALPGVDAAHALVETKPELRGLLKACILAGESDAEIALRCGIATETICLFEALFFHTRDRLEARDWIVSVIGSGLCVGYNTDEDERVLMAFAYFGGPVVCDAILRKESLEPSLRQRVELAICVERLPETLTSRQLVALEATARPCEESARDVASEVKSIRAQVRGWIAEMKAAMNDAAAKEQMRPKTASA